MRNLSTGWTVILLLFIFGFSSCDDDQDVPNNPVIGTAFDVASGDDRFTVLTAALERTGLDNALDVPTARLTVFAPTDAAFAASGIDLSALSDEALTNVLLYHVVRGQSLLSATIPSGRTPLDTENKTGPEGSALPLFVDNNGGTININESATVVAADVQVVNGVIHGIDQVLLPPSILDRARLDGRFTTLIAALERTELDDVVAGEGDFTVFAPTDDAFAAANIDLDAVTDEDLKELLLYHVLGQSIPAGRIASGNSFVTTLNTSGPDDESLSLLIDLSDGNVTLNADAAVVVPDVYATNGVVHALDKVLAYQSIVDFTVKADGVSELEAAVVAAGLVGTLSADGPFTVFAPVNAAFEAIADTVSTLSVERVASILAAHVANGNVTSDELTETMVSTLNMDYMVNLQINPGADSNSTDDDFFQIATSDSTAVNFILTDIQGTNGVIHLIDEVLLPANF
ncbi:MAG: fasciclin domain-containing protein [Lewinella sp.]